MTILKIKSKKLINFINSIWLFPAIMTIILILLSALQINGSSIGMYQKIFYSDQSDQSLIYGKPQAIRSDEWSVNSQKTIAQKYNNFSVINSNIGDGENVSVIGDIPSRDWSTIFKPHNLGFFVLPFDNAFSLRWWVMSYLLILSCYFFVLVLLPKKRLLASLLSLGLLFSPFIQWWYLYGTMGPIYYSLFGAVVFTKILHSRQKYQAILWSALLAYISTSFILILYPPFQIPCALAILAFAVGYLIDDRKNIDKDNLKRNIIYFISAIIMSLAIVGLFIYDKRDVVSTIQNTAYPGQRIIESGGYDLEHFLSSNLSSVFQSTPQASSYSRPLIGATNQSESSNFILLFPFLILPLAYFGIKSYRLDKKINYTLLFSSLATTSFIIWMFIPGLDIAGKISLLDKVPHPRLLIGYGLLNIIFITLFIKIYSQYKKRLGLYPSIIITLLLIIFYLLIDFHVMSIFPGFIGYRLAIAFALPIPIILFFFMRKHFIIGATLLLAFSFASTFHINPLYVGTKILTDTPISNSIRSITETNQKKWVSEDIVLENFATMNGASSITGTYLYPQLDIWRKLNQPDKEPLYNRYAHVNFAFDRNPTNYISPVISAPGSDQFNVRIEPCDNFLKQNNVGFLITSVEFEPGVANCATLTDKVFYSKSAFYIYKLNL